MILAAILTTASAIVVVARSNDRPETVTASDEPEMHPASFGQNNSWSSAGTSEYRSCE